MSNLSVFLAKIELPDMAPIPRRSPSVLLPDILMVLAGCLVVITGAVLWAVFIRKPRDVRSSRGAAKSTVIEAADDLEEGHHKKRKKHRRRRREHRSRNPTLAETGGLAPRSEGPPE